MTSPHWCWPGVRESSHSAINLFSVGYTGVSQTTTPLQTDAVHYWCTYYDRQKKKETLGWVAGTYLLLFRNTWLCHLSKRIKHAYIFQINTSSFLLTNATQPFKLVPVNKLLPVYPKFWRNKCVSHFVTLPSFKNNFLGQRTVRTYTQSSK